MASYFNPFTGSVEPISLWWPYLVIDECDVKLTGIPQCWTGSGPSGQV